METESSPTKSLAQPCVAEVDARQTTPPRPPLGIASPCSPRASVAFSFLAVFEWCRNKFFRLVGRRSQPRPAKRPDFNVRIPSGKCRQNKRLAVVLCPLLLTSAGELALAFNDVRFVARYQEFSDPHGRFATLNLAGPTDTTKNAFFQDLGTNGRVCATCHQASDAWSVTPPHIQDRFNATRGADPIFRPNDGSGCPTQDVSTERARRDAYHLLLTKGLIRIELPVPANAEFTVLNNDNPYGCTSVTAISAYRRPLPTTNIPYLSTVMWDGRQTLKDADGALQPINFDLAQQAASAMMVHAQGQPPTDEQIQQIIDFETHLFTAQTHDREAGDLDDDGAQGGPTSLSQQEFFIGINDPLGMNPTGAPFSSTIFSLFDRWGHIGDRRYDEHTSARRAVARGQRLFNTLPIPITGVAGLNDVLKVDTINGVCGTCHDSPNVGDHSVPAPLNIGLVDASRRTPDLPLITVKCNATGLVTQVSDIGRAMVTGKCADIGKFKGPILRGLSGRAPYFHNGSAATLDDVVDFYNTRFNLKLLQRDKDDLVAFLKTL
jgi:cytochrome c peroxidase